MITNNSVRQF